MDILAGRDLVSCDGQIYLMCGHCGRESRIHYHWLAEPSDLEGRCKACGHEITRRDVVRHLCRDVFHCRDCGAVFEQLTPRFGDMACGTCGSHALDCQVGEVTPPWPLTFDQTQPPKEGPWGVSLKPDLLQIRVEIGHSNSMLDSTSHLLLTVRFCERLEQANAYQDSSFKLDLPNLEANLLLEYCRRTKDLERGIHALELFQWLGTQPGQADSAHYVIALTSHVLLLRFSEDDLANIGHFTLRLDAIQHARAAVDLAQTAAASTPAAVVELAQTEVLLASLLAAGNPGAADMREAIDVAQRALDRDVLTQEGANDMRLERALWISETPGIDPLTLDEAILVTEAGILSLDRTDPRVWNRWANLGAMYEKRGRLSDAVRAWTECADLAKEQLVRAGSAERLADEAGKYLGIFERLGSLLTETGQAWKALAAYETLRAAVLRLSTNESVRTASAVRMVIRHLRRYEANEPEPPETFLTPDIDADLNGIRGLLLDSNAMIVYYGLSYDRVNAFLVFAENKETIRIHSQHWPFSIAMHTVEEAMTAIPIVLQRGGDVRTLVPPLFNGFTYPDPSPLRNKRLVRAAKDAYRHLFAPIEEQVRALGAKRLVICASGLLTSVAFETIADGVRPDWCLSDDFDVLYAPSIGMMRDMGEYPALKAASLLLIGYGGADLPAVDEEIEEIRATWPGRCTVLRGTGLNKRAALQELASPYDFIHFAGHGTFDYDIPSNSAFHFALSEDESAGDAYRLTATDLLTVQLTDHPVVTLSACSSAITSFSDAHSMTGLTGSFLRGGARAIIASRWPVADDVAMMMMCNFYRAIGDGVAPFPAFVQAQRAMRVERPIDEWAAFGYVGAP